MSGTVSAIATKVTSPAADAECSSLPATNNEKGKAKNGGDVVDSILDNARAALNTAADLAPLVPFPLVSTIFVCAKGIVDTAAVRLPSSFAFVVLLMQVHVFLRKFVRTDMTV
jgi:hypothetical protein